MFNNIVEEWIKKAALKEMRACIIVIIACAAYLFVFEKEIFTSDSALFLMLMVIAVGMVIKNFIILLNYEKTKGYRSLENLNYETMQDAEEEVSYEYEHNQENHIFENKHIFISREFIVSKQPIFFMNTEDVSDVRCFTRTIGFITHYHVRIGSDYLGEYVDVQVSGNQEAEQIINILHKKVLGSAPPEMPRADFSISINKSDKSNR